MHHYNEGNCANRERSASSAKANVKGILGFYKSFLNQLGRFHVQSCSTIGPVENQGFECSINVTGPGSSEVIRKKAKQCSIATLLLFELNFFTITLDPESRMVPADSLAN